MTAEIKPPIIVRRKVAAKAAHHGGAWKIAYADFVTAMMAFFLLMWLLGSTTKADLNGIAEYFQTPLKVSLAGGSGSGDSSSVIKGGGTDLTRTVGQKPRSDNPETRRVINLEAARAELERIDAARLADLKRRVDAAIAANPTLRAHRDQIRVEMTPDGLRVLIIDAQSRSMFDSGSARLKDYTRDILRELASVLNDVPNRIALSGHTDASPYAGGDRGYSNWELSADRANASRRELVAGGIDERKVMQVVGLGATAMFDSADPTSPVNRRISITVLNQRAERRILEGAGENAAGRSAAPQEQGAADAASGVGPETGAAPAPSDTPPGRTPPAGASPQAGAAAGPSPSPVTAAATAGSTGMPPVPTQGPAFVPIKLPAVVPTKAVVPEVQPQAANKAATAPAQAAAALAARAAAAASAATVTSLR